MDAYLNEFIANESHLCLIIDFDIWKWVHDLVFLLDCEIIAFIQKHVEDGETLLKYFLVLVVD